MDNTENEKKQEEITNLSTPISWIQRLKDESWEAELLVSAIAIFGTFQLFGLIDWVTNKFIDILSPNQYMVAYFIVFMGLLAVSILISMFVIHLFLRAYWIGLVGLNSVFPDYSLEDSAYSEIYTKKMLSILPKLKDSIQKVDDLCSVIFSAAFGILLIYSYGSITATIYLFIYNLLIAYVESVFLLIPAYILVGVIMLQTITGIIASIKSLKQNEKIQTFYFHVVKLGSSIGFGPLYKSILQITMIFGSNFKRKKSLIGLVVLFLSVGIFLAVFKIKDTNIFYLINQNTFFDHTKTYAGYYASENNDTNFLLTPEIGSDVINSEIMKVFIPIYRHEDELREKDCYRFTENEKLSAQENRIKRRESFLECYHKYNQVYLNGEEQLVDFLTMSHPRTGQFGIVGYVELEHMKKGKNILTVKKTSGKEVFNEWSIPFYSVVKRNSSSMTN